MIKANYFSPENTAKRNYFQQLPSQVRNALRKQYEKYMQQVRMTIPFFLWFFKYRKPLKRVATSTSRKTIENSPHNKKLLEQQNFILLHVEVDSKIFKIEDSKLELSISHYLKLSLNFLPNSAC